MSGTYPAPADGWVCFHCGERFLSPGDALDHFGHRPVAVPACDLKPEDLRRFRGLEDERNRMLDFLRDDLCDLHEALPGGRKHPVEQDRLKLVDDIGTWADLDQERMDLRRGLDAALRIAQMECAGCISTDKVHTAICVRLRETFEEVRE